MKKYFLFSLLAFFVVTLSACGSSESTAVTPVNSGEDSTEAKPVAVANQTDENSLNSNVDKNKLKQELAGISGADSAVEGDSGSQSGGEEKNIMMNIDPSKFENLQNKYSQATFKTNLGSFTIKLAGEKAPKTVNNFLNLAKLGYYDGVKFHRVIAGFMIQGGDQNSKDDTAVNTWGMGGPGYAIEDEFGAGLSNQVGTISMANAGPNTGGSQFFINVNDNSYLDGRHAVFGSVVDGMEVVNSIAKTSTGPNDRPVTPVVIESIVLK